MTRLRCVCGAVVEGTEKGLLEAVERHLADAHAVVGVPDDVMSRHPSEPSRAKYEVAQLDDERSTPSP